MKGKITILVFVLFYLVKGITLGQQSLVKFDFCGQQLNFPADKKEQPYLKGALSAEAIISFYNQVLNTNYPAAVQALKDYKQKYQPDDWLYYQLIRKTAQSISPKENNYFQYTLYKWFFLKQSGYDAIIAITPTKMLFYIQCDENIYNIPFRMRNGKQYVCLNYHDYEKIDFIKENFIEVVLPAAETEKTFSYKVTKIPDFQATEYLEKDLHFTYNENEYHFKLKLTPQIQKLFNNYPVVDYSSYMNIPLSKETYNSLIPQLKKNMKGMKVKTGVDFLMRFTRYAFLFEPDSDHFGNEKRLSPEQTLFYDQSDCEDRVALFFYLVKEIYDLPMIVMEYPNHVSVAVKFDKPYGKTIKYNGIEYSVCEPTPQKEDLSIGQTLPELNHAMFEVPFTYFPHDKK
jgi:hypothetical protein